MKQIFEYIFNLTIQELAEKLRVSSLTIIRWEDWEQIIPDKYVARLTEIFGVDKKFFEDITEENYKSYEQEGDITHVEGDESEHESKNEDYSKTEKSSDERYTTVTLFESDHRSPKDRYNDATEQKLKTLFKIEETIDYYDIPNKLMDKIVAINRGCAVFLPIVQLMEEMPKYHPKLKMAYYWEIHHVLMAMMLAHEAITRREVEEIPIDHDNLNTQYDGTDFIIELSEIIRSHKDKVFGELI